MNTPVNLYVSDIKSDQTVKTHFYETVKLIDNRKNSVLAPRQEDCSNHQRISNFGYNRSLLPKINPLQQKKKNDSVLSVPVTHDKNKKALLPVLNSTIPGQFLLAEPRSQHCISFLAQATGYGSIFEPQQSKVVKNPIKIVNEAKIHKVDTSMKILNSSKVLDVSFSSVEEPGKLKMSFLSAPNDGFQQLISNKSNDQVIRSKSSNVNQL